MGQRVTFREMLFSGELSMIHSQTVILISKVVLQSISKKLKFSKQKMYLPLIILYYAWLVRIINSRWRVCVFAHSEVKFDWHPPASSLEKSQNIGNYAGSFHCSDPILHRAMQQWIHIWLYILIKLSCFDLVLFQPLYLINISSKFFDIRYWRSWSL